ncbi:MAG TPA: ComEC/Rec2 family competence protein [Candidatus Deferrimicrobiaceae bacterium]|jgi:competence protein ComEC
MQTRPFQGTAPFFLLSAAFLLGHVVGLAACDAWGGVAAGFGLLALLSAAFHLPAPTTAGLVMALCGALASGRAGFVDPVHARPFFDNETVIRGIVPSVRHTDSGWSGIADDVTLSTLDGSKKLRLGHVAISIRNPDASAVFPAQLRATGRLHTIRSMGNGIEIPREWEVLANGTQFIFSAEAGKTVLLPCTEGDSLFPSARERTGRWIERVTGKSEGGLYLLSLANGQVPPSRHPLVVLFRQTGLAHLFAISGINVAIFYAMHAFCVRALVWGFLRRRGGPDLNRISCLASLPICWAYVLMAGLPIPAIRSAGMITIAVLLWHAFGVRGAGFCFSLVFLFAVLGAPFAFLTPSFQLSFVAVFFLIAATGGNDGQPELGHGINGYGSRTLHWIIGAIEASGVAFFGTLPVAAAFFQGVPAGAILWNVLFGPLLGTAGVAGAFLAVIGGVFQVRFLETPVRWTADLLGWEIGWLRRLSGDGAGYCRLPPVGAGAMTAAVLFAAAGALWLRSRGRKAWPAPLAGALLLLAWIHLPYLAMPDARLTLTALNVGNGASHVIGFPGGGTMVLDCGSALRGDSGARILVPFLRSQGVRKVDLLILSHPHEDHYGGACALLEAMPVSEVWIPEDVPKEGFGPALANYRGVLRAVGRGVERICGGAVVSVRSAGEGDKNSANASSLVIEARYGRFCAWLPGDIEGGPSAWGPIRDHKQEWRALFLPHHGSPGADPEGWVTAGNPDIAVIQNRNCLAGKNLITSERVLALENGALTFMTDGRSVRAIQENGYRFWQLLCRQY